VTGAVHSLRVTDNGTELSLTLSGGEQTTVRLAARPDHRSSHRVLTGVRRPLAIFLGDGVRAVDAVLLGTSRRGPVRLNIPLGAALALCDAGVHTVLLSRSENEE